MSINSVGSSIILCLSIFILASSATILLPDDVELIQGQQPVRFWEAGPGIRRKSLHTEGLDTLFEATRNRRAVKYHIKSSPTINRYYEEDDAETPSKVVPRHYIKRDLNSVTNMDVFAQYMEQLAIDQVRPRSKREIIEEEDKNGNRREVEFKEPSKTQQWIPQGIRDEDEDDIFKSIKSNTSPPETSSASVITAEALTDNPNGRGIRGATKDQWIKLPFLARPLENDQLSSSSANPEEANRRMPRVNFVTHGKGLQTAESRNQRESIPRGSYSRSSDLRTDIYPPEKDSRARSLDYSMYSRRSYYYPDDYSNARRPSYEDYGSYDDPYAIQSQRRDPYYGGYDRNDYKNGRRYDYSDYSRFRDPYDRYDGYEDNYRNQYEKPRRIIYYANLPDVVRTPPNVYRYSSTQPYNRYDDDRYYNRDSRYNDYRGGAGGGGGYSPYPYSRYPYSPLKKSENEGPRDLSSSSTANKEKSENIKREQEQVRKANDDSGRSRDNSLNSHQYPISLSTDMNVDDSSKSPHQTLYHDITRMDSDFHRYDHPSFQAAVDDPYISRHD